MRNLFFLITIGLLIINCSKESGLNYHIEKRDGMTIFINDNFPSKKDLEINISELFTISGENFYDSTSAFSRITSWALSQNGDIYLLDQKTSSIKRFDEQGNYLGCFGQRGSGPGEFVLHGNISSMLSYKNSIYVVDPSRMDILHYNFTGKFIDNIRINKIPLFMEVLNDDRIISCSLTPNITEKGMKLIFSTNMLDLSFGVEKELDRRIFDINPQKPINPMEVYPRFTTTENDEIYLAEISEDKYVINIYDSKGKKHKEIRKKYRKIPFLKKDFNTNNSIAKNDKKTPKYKKSIDALFRDSQNRIWVATAKNKDEESDLGIKFDIFKDGIYLNSFTFDLPISNRNIALFHYMKIYNDKIYILNSEENYLKVYSYNFNM